MDDISRKMAEIGVRQLGGRPKTATPIKPKEFGVTLALGAGVIGGAMGLEKSIEALHNVATYKKDYENMLSFAPEIKNYDKEQVKARFDTLRRFNRKMSSDPLVSSSWVKQTIEYPIVTPATLKDVISPDRRPVAESMARAIPKGVVTTED